MFAVRLHHLVWVLAILLPPLGGAAAAPQVLGVVAISEARPMTCAEGRCVAHLSTFCIQRAREAPATGTVYAPAPGERGIALVVTTAEGARLRLPAGPYLRFESQGGYSSVRASLAQDSLRALGGAAASLEVGALAVLVPEPVPGDPDPLSELEIALATGPLRAAAQDLFDRAGNQRADAARLTSVLINALPEHRPPTVAERDELWARNIGAGMLEGLSEVATKRAQMAYGACRWQAEHGYGKGLRDCLRATHDALMMDVNQTYWDRIGGV